MNQRTKPGLREHERRLSLNAAMCGEWEGAVARTKRTAEQLARAVLRGDTVTAKYLAKAILSRGNP